MDGIISIKWEETARPVKIFYTDKLCQIFPEIDFGDTVEDDNIFLDVSQAATGSVQSSY